LINGGFRFLIGGLFFFLLTIPSSLYGQKTAVLAIDDLHLIQKKATFTYRDSFDLQQKIETLQFQAYKKGFLTFSVDSIIQLDSTKTSVKGSLGPQIKKWKITMDEPTRQLIRSISFSPKTIENAPPNPLALSQTLADILSKLENNGYPFAQVYLNGLQQDGAVLTAELIVNSNARLKWLELEVVGNNIKLSPKFIANYFHIEEGSWYKQEDVNLIATRFTQLTYIKETKPAELLFTPEGVKLYLYIESKPVSSFNGTIGLQQNPVTLTYQLTGDLRLKLQNVLKRGELFELSWRSIQPGSPQLKTQLSYPFLFNTPFGIDGQFQLFKRDSTFLELKTGLGVNYFLSAGNVLKAFYKNHQSNLLSAGNNSTNYGTMRNNQYGLALQHQTIDYLPNPRKGFIWSIEASAGNRSLTKDSVTAKSLVIGTALQIDWYIPLSKRFVLKTGLNSESYTSDSIQTNELIRFGGNLNQRGFMEDELLATFKSTASIELRFILDRNSNLFAFYDQTWYERNTKNYSNDAPRGFGAGLRFGTNIGIFSLTYALGKQLNNPLLFRDSKIHFGYVAYF
jgi:outer membrane protein assembly factor BamA